MPWQLESWQWARDILAPVELERGAERVPEREPQNAAHHPFPQVIHRCGAYRDNPRRTQLAAPARRQREDDLLRLASADPV
jgi:hypothetical protein